MRQVVSPCIVALCGDPGGANAVAPVIEALRVEERVTLKALAYRQAQMLWAKRFLSFDSVSESTTHNEAVALLRGCSVGLLLTGTSVNRVELEKTFIAAAREAEVPSLAVLDFWSNYRMRFSDGAGMLVYLPDRIAVMDERARGEMVNDGFELTRLVITGQPALDDLPLLRDRFSPVRHKEIQKELGIRSRERLVLFVSQPISVLYGEDPTAPGHLGYTEQIVLEALHKALSHIAQRSGQEIVLVIRPHPRENAPVFKNSSYEPVRIIMSTVEDPRDMVMAADVVTGMNSMLLVEACYLGCLTVSLQPGLRLPDALPTNQTGQSIVVYQEHEIETILERLLKRTDNHSPLKKAGLKQPCNATQRVVTLAYKMMGLDAHS